MRELDEEAKAKNLVFINECGVDPGTDHMRYGSSPRFLSFVVPNVHATRTSPPTAEVEAEVL
jgi:hypothetical protein